MEYFIVLFGIRYDKHWRTTAVGVVTGGSGGGKVTLATALRPSPSPIRLRAGESSSIQINNDAPVSSGLGVIMRSGEGIEPPCY